MDFSNSPSQRLDPVTGALTAVDSLTAKSLVSSYNATTGVCKNAINYMTITIQYNADATSGGYTLVQVREGNRLEIRPTYVHEICHCHHHFILQGGIGLALIVTDIPSTAPSFSQSVRVVFVPSPYVGVTQPLSGNPGYLTGFPLLVRDEAPGCLGFRSGPDQELHQEDGPRRSLNQFRRSATRSRTLRHRPALLSTPSSASRRACPFRSGAPMAAAT